MNYVNAICSGLVYCALRATTYCVLSIPPTRTTNINHREQRNSVHTTPRTDTKSGSVEIKRILVSMEKLKFRIE